MKILVGGGLPFIFFFVIILNHHSNNNVFSYNFFPKSGNKITNIHMLTNIQKLSQDSTLASLDQLNYGNWSVLILLIKAQAYIPWVRNFNNLRGSNSFWNLQNFCWWIFNLQELIWLLSKWYFSVKINYTAYCGRKHR